MRRFHLTLARFRHSTGIGVSTELRMALHGLAVLARGMFLWLYELVQATWRFVRLTEIQ